MTQNLLDFKSILSITKEKLNVQGSSTESKIQITSNDIETLEKLHTAACSNIFFTIENPNKTHLFIPDAFNPFVINKNNFEAFFFPKSNDERDKLMANYFYGDSLIVEFQKHIEMLDLNKMTHAVFKKGEEIEFVIDFHESKLKITY